MAATLFHGAGLALVLVAGTFLILMPVYQNGKYFLFGRDQEQPKRIRCATLCSMTIALVTVACIYGPWPFSIKAPAVVDYGPRGIVRAGADGFVETVHVQSGSAVKQDQLLATLFNAQLTSEVRRLEYELEASKTKIRIASTRGDVPGQKLEHETRRDLELQLAERRSQLDNLEIRAPMDGMIVSTELDSKLGTFLREGEEFLMLGDETKKEIVLSISQDDADLFHAHEGESILVKMRGGQREKFTLDMG